VSIVSTFGELEVRVACQKNPGDRPLTLLLLHPRHAFGFFSTPPSLPVTLPAALALSFRGASNPSSSDSLDLSIGGNEDDTGGAEAGGIGI
jgi:hypothetical protein